MLGLHVLNFEGSGTAYVPGPTPEDVLQSGAVAASTRGALSYIFQRRAANGWSYGDLVVMATAECLGRVL